MGSKRRGNGEIYWRGGRAYGDFRPWSDVGGDREALKVPGEKMATTDRKMARKLRTARVDELDERRDERRRHGHISPTLAEYARDHLKTKAQMGEVTSDWLDLSCLYLTRAVEYFGANRPLDSIRVADVRKWTVYLSTTTFAPRLTRPRQPGGPEPKGRPLSRGTVRHMLNVLFNLYDMAENDELIEEGRNPVKNMKRKPKRIPQEARWLEVHQGALLLESARTLPASSQKDALPADFAHALIATHLLTGGRSAEVLGLEVDDVSFERQTVTFRPNAWRRLKTLPSARVVPLWPQLAEILRSYAGHGGNLLFPSLITGQEAMLKEWRGTLDRVAVRAGWKKGEIRSRIFRHTYTAARLQTLDGGAPVSPYTVSRELGHGSLKMCETVYSHLGSARVRSEYPEYRIAEHRARVAEQLEKMGL